jgi:hypothetical protein
VRSSKEPILRVQRRCLVCDWEGEMEEPEDTDAIGPPCAECRAPTERLAVKARHSAVVHRNPYAAALGRLGGLKGGPARAAALSPARRREIALQAIHTRWRKKRQR